MICQLISTELSYKEGKYVFNYYILIPDLRYLFSMWKTLVQIFPCLIQRLGLKNNFHLLKEWVIGITCEGTNLFPFKVTVFQLKTGMGTAPQVSCCLVVWFRL